MRAMAEEEQRVRIALAEEQRSFLRELMDQQRAMREQSAMMMAAMQQMTAMPQGVPWDPAAMGGGPQSLFHMGGEYTRVNSRVERAAPLADDTVLTVVAGTGGCRHGRWHGRHAGGRGGTGSGVGGAERIRRRPAAGGGHSAGGCSGCSGCA